MAQIFRPYADSVARATLVTLLLGPFAIAACLLDHAIELHHYVTDQTITFDQLPFSHAHHVGGLASTAVTATPG